jgi:hypothetical protein
MRLVNEVSSQFTNARGHDQIDEALAGHVSSTSQADDLRGVCDLRTFQRLPSPWFQFLAAS